MDFLFNVLFQMPIRYTSQESSCAHDCGVWGDFKFGNKARGRDLRIVSLQMILKPWT